MIKKIELTPLGQIIWEDRYGLKDDKGTLIEKDILETFQRVSKFIAAKEKDPNYWKNIFYDIMVQGHYTPAGRILAQAGTNYSQLFNCFVLPFEDDSLEAIMDTAKNTAIIQKHGGGCIGGESIVITDKGPMPIKDIVEDVATEYKVLSYNENTKEVEYCDILDRHTMSLPGYRVYEITYNDKGSTGVIRASDWHPFFVADGDNIIQIRADKLQAGMILIGYVEGKAIPCQTVLSVRRIGVEEILYDFTVDKNQTYLASDPSIKSFIVVHNTGFNYTTLRPSGSYIKGVNGRSCGVLGFMNMLSVVSEVIEQGGCFVADTLVATPQGPKKIIDLKKDDVVYSMSKEGFKEKPCSCDAWRTKENAEVWKVTTNEGQVFFCTKDHPLMPSKGFDFNKNNYLKVQDISNEAIMSLDNRGSCKSGEVLISAEFSHYSDVWNVEVCDLHNFVVCNEDMTCGVVVSNSRRGANLGLLEVTHPDVWEFISYKNEHNWDKMKEFLTVQDEEKWSYFKYENLYKLQMYNISVGITDEFLTALKNDSFWPLKWKDTEWDLYTVIYKKSKGNNQFIEKNFEVTADSDKTAIWKVRKIVPFPKSTDIFEISGKRRIKAKEIWDRICYNAWADGCPGIINVSRMRSMHNLEYARPFLSVNPCGEQALSSKNSCNLSSVILPSFVNDGVFDFDLFKQVVRVAVRFADNVIDACDYPIPDIKVRSLEERRVGLGTMGVHDMLIAMKLGYDTEEGRNFVESVLKVMRDEAYQASIDLAKEKGSFPLLHKEKFLDSGFMKTMPQAIRMDILANGIRNSTLLTQAPTGSVGTMFNVSTGCEPWPFLELQRNTRLGSYDDGCPGYLQWKKENPNADKIPEYFRTAQEISPEDHVKMMAIFSKYVCSSVSKTVNISNSATPEDISNAFLMAMDMGIKGLTVFRDGSKEGIFVNRASKDKKILEEAKKLVENLEEVKQDFNCTEDAVIDSRMAPRKRGNRATGATYRVYMQGHNLYITVNRNSVGELVEVFATVGESKAHDAFHTSGVEDSWAEGLGKIISLALRAGVTPASVIKNLKNIPSDKPVFVNIDDNASSELIPSPPHAIARAMEEELKYSNVAQTKSDTVAPRKGHCEECGSDNIKFKSPTCYECLDCAFSRCS